MPRSLRFAVLGFGNVGQGFAIHAARRRQRLIDDYGVEPLLVAAIDSSVMLFDENGLDAAALAAAKEGGRPLGGAGGPRQLGGLNALFAAGLDCLVDCLPTNRVSGEPGLSWARAAIGAGCSVVFADKGPVLLALDELEMLARESGVRIGFNGTTGGSLPTLSLARRELAGARVIEVSGILNGTTNLILSRMREQRCTYVEALSEAQSLGIAEPDPSYDIQGWDTATKLSIIAAAVFRRSIRLEDVEVCGIEGLAAPFSEDARWRLIGRARLEDQCLVLTVRPERVSSSHPFYGVDGARKAVRFVTDDLGDLVVAGGASGRTDIAATLLKDMLVTTGVVM
jgi:homoserine dehydrogenase